MHIPDKLSEKAKYLLLLSYVVDDLPANIIELAVQAEFPYTPDVLSHIRHGRKHDLEALCALIELGLPKFSIPDELRPIGYDFGSKWPMPVPGRMLTPQKRLHQPKQ